MKEQMIYVLLGLVVAFVVTYLAFGVVVGLSVFSAGLLVILMYQNHAIYRLYQWLADKNDHPPKFSKHSIWHEMLEIHKKNDERHQKNKAQLHHALSRLDHLVAAIPTGVMMVSQGGYVDWASELGREHFGLHKLAAKNPIVFSDKADGFNLIEHIASKELSEFLADVPVQSPSEATLLIVFGQKKKWLKLSLVPFEAKTSLLVSEDVSSREQLNATRADFVANVSHELRTPLTVIQGFLETLQDYPDIDDETKMEFLGLMTGESQKMLGIINDLLELSRLENISYATMDKSVVNLSDLCQMIKADTESLAKTHITQHRIMAAIDDDVWIMGSTKDLYSGLSNLAFNAVLHTPVDTSITIGLTKQGNKAVFFVKDTGQGIAAEHLPRLTERFYRVSSGRERTYETQGSGLGLAITKYALFEHGSELFVESKVGVGTRFWAEFDLVDCQS